MTNDRLNELVRVHVELCRPLGSRYKPIIVLPNISGDTWLMEYNGKPAIAYNKGNSIHFEKIPDSFYTKDWKRSLLVRVVSENIDRLVNYHGDDNLPF